MTGSDRLFPESGYIRVTATDLASGDSDTKDLRDDYCLVTAGRCEMTYVNVTTCKDGSETHVLTIKGVRRG